MMWNFDFTKPGTVTLAELVDGLLLATVQVYSPAVVTARVWVYCAVAGSLNTVWVPSVTLAESLVQVTVVAGPPVEIQVVFECRSIAVLRFGLHIKGIENTQKLCV